MMKIDILSLFPKYFESPLSFSIMKRAIEKNILEIGLVDIRDFSKDKHKRVDDRPYGGGPGMVMMAEPLQRAIDSVKRKDSYVIGMSPQGKKFDMQKAEKLSKKTHLIFVCGHYEGMDERVEFDEELSIGDYVLTNGCIASLVVIDAMIRFLPKVLGNDKGVWEDSFNKDLLEGPCYTRPRKFKKKAVPSVLLNGDHKKIEAFRYKKALEKTKKNRPDLYKKHKERVGEKFSN